jgi:acyl carrier protein
MMHARQEVKQKMAAFLRLPVTKLDDAALLTDVVVESFALVEMVIRLQDDLGVRLIQEDLNNVKTVGELAQLFEGLSKQEVSETPR